MGPLNLLDEFRFQAHGPKALDLAVNVMVAVDQPDILHSGPDLRDTTGPFQLQVLDHRDSVAVLQDPITWHASRTGCSTKA